MEKLSVAFGLSIFFLMACSESNSDGGVTQPSDGGVTQTSNPSKCDLATQNLPASSLAWQPSFAGCEVAQQFRLEELQTFDQLLISMGYQKNALTQESYIYSLNRNDFDKLITYNDTLRFTYAAGFFSGNFNAAERVMTEDEIQRFAVLEACPTLMPSGFLYENFDPCTSLARVVSTGDKSWSGSQQINYSTAAALKQAFSSLGWKCTTKEENYGTNFNCSASFNGRNYTMTARTSGYQNYPGALVKMSIVYNR